MKAVSIMALVFTTVQPALAQEWECDGRDNGGNPMEVLFTAVSSTVIKEVFVKDPGDSISEITGRTRRDAGYVGARYRNFNKFDVSGENHNLGLLLPKGLANLDDEFTAYLQMDMGTADADTIRLTCSGAGSF